MITEKLQGLKFSEMKEVVVAEGYAEAANEKSKVDLMAKALELETAGKNSLEGPESDVLPPVIEFTEEEAVIEEIVEEVQDKSDVAEQEEVELDVVEQKEKQSDDGSDDNSDAVVQDMEKPKFTKEELEHKLKMANIHINNGPSEELKKIYGKLINEYETALSELQTVSDE